MKPRLAYVSCIGTRDHLKIASLSKKAFPNTYQDILMILKSLKRHHYVEPAGPIRSKGSRSSTPLYLCTFSSPKVTFVCHQKYLNTFNDVFLPFRSISTAKNESQPSCSMSKRPCPPLLPPLSITNSTFTKTYSFSYILSLQPKECPHTHDDYRALSFLNKLSCPSMSRNRRKNAPYVLPLESLHPKPTSQAGMMLCLPSPSWTIIQRS
jgi:hypothetical protein